MQTTNNNNWPGKIFPLSENDLKKISSGAIVVIIAQWLRPQATQQEIADTTGYSPRQVRNLTREIEKSRLLCQPPPDNRPLTADQKKGRSALIEYGFDHATAERLARQHPAKMICNAIAYIRSCKGIVNPRGAVINWLKRNEAHTTAYRADEHAADDISRFWDEEPTISSK